MLADLPQYQLTAILSHYTDLMFVTVTCPNGEKKTTLKIASSKKILAISVTEICKIDEYKVGIVQYTR